MAKVVNRLKNIMTKAGKKILHKHSPASTEVNTRQTVTRNIRRQESASGQITPSYLLIAEQLNADHEQIFQAAVYNLVKIAQNRPRYRKNILSLLQEKAAERSWDKNTAAYLNAEIARIKNT